LTSYNYLANNAKILIGDNMKNLILAIAVVITVGIIAFTEMRVYANENYQKATIRRIEIYVGENQEDMLNALGVPDMAWAGDLKQFRYQYKSGEYTFVITVKDGIIQTIARLSRNESKQPN
jgi:Tfp pilus assembly protein PilV